MEPQDNFFGELFIAIMKRLAEKVPEIKYVNIDIGQLEVYTMDSPSVSWPCCLVDFTDTRYADLHQGEQEADGTLVVRLGFNPFSQTSNLQPDEVKRKGLYYFTLENKIHWALHGWQPLNEAGEAICQPLFRRRAGTERREEDAFRVRAIAFAYSFFDDGGKPEVVTINPDLDIQNEF